MTEQDKTIFDNEAEIIRIKVNFLTAKRELEKAYQKEIEELKWIIFNQTKAHLNENHEEEKILWAEYQKMAQKIEVETYFPELVYKRF